MKRILAAVSALALLASAAPAKADYVIRVIRTGQVCPAGTYPVDAGAWYPGGPHTILCMAPTPIDTQGQH